VIIPAQNKKDLVDIPKRIRREMNIIFASQMDEVLKHALIMTKKQRSKKTAKTVGSAPAAA
jgi:ATP-dependent Lon protease